MATPQIAPAGTSSSRPARPKRFTVHARDPFPGGRIVRYTWHWGDGHVTHTTSATAAHRYRSDGRVLVQVKAVDNYGQSRIIGHRLTVSG